MNTEPDEDDDGVMELLWQNGNVVVQKSSRRGGGRHRINDAAGAEELQRLFIQDSHEDHEMAAAWFHHHHHPIEEEEPISFARDASYSDFFSSALPPPIPPPHRRSDNSPNTPRPAGESAIVESNEAPIAAEDSRTMFLNTERAGGLADGARDLTVTSSPRDSYSGGAERRNRKRKGGESDSEFDSEDAKFQATEARKQPRKRSRAAQVHNLSERRRRDRINEKMKALQEMIPRCNKSDKASMLDDAIEYMKSLQMQMQMMSMGYGMVPMMYPGMQQYMPAMGLGMGMAMGMNRPIMPHPSLLPGPSTEQTGPVFPHPPMQNSIDQNQQFLDHQAQIPSLSQNRAVLQQLTIKPSTSNEAFRKPETNL